jgi:hypothetical protein
VDIVDIEGCNRGFQEVGGKKASNLAHDILLISADHYHTTSLSDTHTTASLPHTRLLVAVREESGGVAPQVQESGQKRPGIQPTILCRHYRYQPLAPSPPPARREKVRHATAPWMLVHKHPHAYRSPHREGVQQFQQQCTQTCCRRGKSKQSRCAQHSMFWAT